MGIARAALTIMVGNATSRLLGMVRELVIAGLFGATGTVDAFTAAYRVPAMVYDLLVGGLISAALVPVFSDYAQEDPPQRLWHIAGVFLSLISLVLAGMVAVLFFFSQPIMDIFGYGFSPETKKLAVTLLQFMLPAVLLMGVAGVITALLYSRQQFVFSAFCAAAFNAGIIIMALLLQPLMGVGSLVVGVLFGALLQVILQLYPLRKMRFKPRLNLSHPAVIKITRLYLPVAAGLVVTAIGIAIDTNLASQTGEGNLAAMRFATGLVQFPLGLVATATTTAILPTLSRYSSNLISPDYPSPATPDSLHKYKATLALGIKMILLAILPATVGLIILRHPLIQILFQRGNFDADATSRTALAFLGYSPGLPAAALDQTFIFAFYAMKNTLTPVLVGVLGVGVYLVVALSLISPLSFFGLALATSAQIVAHTIVMFVLLWRAIGGFSGLKLGQVALRSLVASGVMGGVCLTLASYWSPSPGIPTTMSLVIFLGAISGLGFIVYVLVLIALRTEEVSLAWQKVRGGWQRLHSAAK